MIDTSTTAGLARIEARERDVTHAYEPGFVPEASDVAAGARTIASPDPLSVAAPSGTFFLADGGSGAVRFTRDGTFGIVEGLLCGPDGRAVLGLSLGDRRALGPLRVDAYDRALGRAGDPRIDADGTFSYRRTTIDPRTGDRRGERIAVGTIALARFPAGTQPVRLDATHVAPPSGVKAQVGLPSEGSFAPLVSRARDLGGVDVVAGLEKVREAYETFEALGAARRAQGSAVKTTLDLVK